nr:hypothetical protein [Streptomyces tsukubensis]
MTWSLVVLASRWSGTMPFIAAARSGLQAQGLVVSCARTAGHAEITVSSQNGLSAGSPSTVE